VALLVLSCRRSRPRAPILLLAEPWVEKRAEDFIEGPALGSSVPWSRPGRIRPLAERYVNPLPTLVREVEEMAARGDAHLARMGFRP
jgi:hypothetical protein